MTYQGKIVMFHPAKGWGFLSYDDNEWFFHLSNCAAGFQPTLGALVEFEIAPPLRLGQKDQAVNVRPVGGAA